MIRCGKGAMNPTTAAVMGLSVILSRSSNGSSENPSIPDFATVGTGTSVVSLRCTPVNLSSLGRSWMDSNGNWVWGYGRITRLPVVDVVGSSSLFSIFVFVCGLITPNHGWILYTIRQNIPG